MKITIKYEYDNTFYAHAYIGEQSVMLGSGNSWEEAKARLLDKLATSEKETQIVPPNEIIEL